MNRTQAIKFFFVVSAIGFSVIFISSCKGKLPEGTIVFTQVSGKLHDNNPANTDSVLQNLKARIVVLYRDKVNMQPVVLTDGFYSARSPEISPDGTMVLFTARKNKEDKWQIWEINLKNKKSRQVISLSENCVEPAYLPTGRLIFSKLTLNNDLNGANAIFSCNPDGSDIRQLTFDPYNYRALTVLQDGRVMAISRKPVTESVGEAFMVLRPDGTKNELFYEGTGGRTLCSRVRETNNGKIIFAESDQAQPERGNLISISYNEPFHSYTNLTSGTGGDFISVYPLISGKYLVSYRKTRSDHYGLFEFNPDDKSLGKELSSSQEFDITEVVSYERHVRPKKLPSEVDMGVKTGLILCQDINFHGIQSSGSVSALPKTYKIRIVGRDSVLGEVDVEKDGSFYLKVIADTPFRIETLDERGRPLSEPCNWIYLRPNERRGCVGCHEGQETVPENKVSLAVKQAPVNVPVHISKVVEKKVSLE